jgi:thioredoxin 1
MMKKDSEIMASKTDSMMKGGSYESYSPEKIAMASSAHNVVLFFHASWCPTCIALDKDIKSHVKDIPSNLTILDVDYDTSTSLKQKYGVTVQHTLVEVDAKGNLIKKWLGSPTLADLASKVK